MALAQRSHWSGRLGFILASAGAAIGLGNIWKFPYMAGDNGGGAFVLVYLACVVLVGLPVMAAEIMVGRRAQKNPVDAIKQLSNDASASKRWPLLGWWGLLGLLVTLSFYSVVAGWSLFYLQHSLLVGFQYLSPAAVKAVWGHLLASPTTLTAYHLSFMALTMLVVANGVEQGLERASRIMMPLLFLMLFILVGFAYATTGPAFTKAVHYLFDCRFSAITGSVMINAMGHAFFTLAVGVGAMAIYGSYLDKNVSILKSIGIIASLDVLVALLAGLAIFPILFQYHLSPQAGPGLMFIVLPMAFAKMHGGNFIAALFFGLLLFAAWTSSINIAEPLVGSLREKSGLSRTKSSIIVGIAAALLGLLSVLSFNIFSGMRVLGHFDLFTLITDLSTNIFLPIGGIGYALFAGWVMHKKATLDELNPSSPLVYSSWRLLIRFIAPIAIGVVLISGFT